jgi:hypothetical protein
LKEQKQRINLLQLALEQMQGQIRLQKTMLMLQISLFQALTFLFPALNLYSQPSLLVSMTEQLQERLEQ